jgi:hypothetical protein
VIYRILVHVDVDARDDRQAVDWAAKLHELLQNPLVRAAIEAEGIRVTGQQVYQPQRR